MEAPETASLEAERDELMVIAHSFPDIETQSQYEEAAKFVTIRCNGVIKDIEAEFEPTISSLKKARSEAEALLKKVLGNLPEAMKIVESKMKAYLTESNKRKIELEKELSRESGTEISLRLPTAPGVQARKLKSVRVTDPVALVSWLAERDLLEVVKFESRQLINIIKAHKAVPGAEIEENFSIVKKV